MLGSSFPGMTLAGVWIAAFGIIGIFIRQIGPWRKQAADAENVFRNDLLARVTKLERRLDRQRVRHEAERAVDRHRLNNLQQCFDATMLMLKASPEKAPEIIEHIERMREAQLAAEAIEKASIHRTMMDALRDDNCEDDEE
jgi:hypothetical protein